MAERVHDCTLEHALYRMRPLGFVVVFFDRTVINRTGSQGSLVHGSGIVYKQLDSHGCEAGRFRTARAVRRRLVGEKQLRSSHRKSCDSVFVA